MFEFSDGGVMIEVLLQVRDESGQLIDPAGVGIDALVTLMRARPPSPPPGASPGGGPPGCAPPGPLQPSADALTSIAVVGAQLAALFSAAVCAVADDVVRAPGLDTTLDEVAAALVISCRSALYQRDNAETLRANPGVWAALAAGALDATKARVLSELLLEIPCGDPEGLPRAGYEAEYQMVLARGLEYAAEHTARQLDTFLLRLLAEVGVEVAARRRRAALAQRGVWVRHRGDGTADLAAVLASEDAERVYAAIRAVALVDRDRTPDACPDRRSDGSCACQGRPCPADPARGCLDHWMADALVDMIVRTGSGPAAGDAPDEAGAGVRVTTSITVTIPIDSLAGLVDTPAVLDGFGAIPADVARRLAAGDARWRHVLVHRGSGALLDVGTLSYRPPAALDRHVRLRDLTCRFPGCRVPSRECDLDHLVPFPAGPTSAANLHSLCRHHHRLKHEGGWLVEGLAEHRLRWTSPLGAVAVTHPEDVRPALAA